MRSLIRQFTEDFAKIVEKQSDSAALIINTEISPEVITYRHLDELISRCLSLFRQKGLVPGDTILSLLPNSAETLVVFLATIRGGYGFAPLNCSASVLELSRWVEVIKPGFCIFTDLISEEMRGNIIEKKISLLCVEVNAQFDWLPQRGEELMLGKQPRIYLSTSGTTGEPKALVLDANRLWSSGRAFMEFHNRCDPLLRFWNYLPMSYLGGLYNLGLIPLCVGGSIVIDEPFSGKTFLQFWQTVERYDVNALWFVPTIVRGLLKMADRTQRKDPKKWGGKIKVAFLGTAPIDLNTKKSFEDTFGFHLLENFALSETTFFTTEVESNIKNRTENSVGGILPYADLKFVPCKKDEEQQCQVSEIFVRSPFLFLGYLGSDGALVDAVEKDGYFRTSDCGHLNKAHLLIIDGRIRDIIKKGGHFVSLREVEALAEQNEAVREAAAVAIKHDFYGESFNLFLILNERFDESSVADVSKFIHKNLVQYKWPDKIIIRKEFSRTPTGKIIKHLLSEGISHGAS